MSSQGTKTGCLVIMDDGKVLLAVVRAINAAECEMKARALAEVVATGRVHSTAMLPNADQLDIGVTYVSLAPSIRTPQTAKPSSFEAARQSAIKSVQPADDSWVDDPEALGSRRTTKRQPAFPNADWEDDPEALGPRLK